MLIYFLLKKIFCFFAGFSYVLFAEILAWIFPILLVLIIMSIFGVGTGKLMGSIFKCFGTIGVNILSWIFNNLPKFLKKVGEVFLKIFKFFRNVAFAILPDWLAVILTIVVIVII